MKKTALFFFILILVASIMFTVPVRSEESDYFTFIEAYWSATQPMEVSPGDVAVLTVVLKQEVIFDLKGLEAVLSMPLGFEAVGGTDNASVIYTGTISIGSLVKLEFPIFITLDVQKGNYTADLILEYYVSGFECEDKLAISFEVTGKPSVSVKVLNGALCEGKQKVLIATYNDGDAFAKNVKIVKVSSVSAIVELLDVEVLGDLEPGDHILVPLSLFVPLGMTGKNPAFSCRS